MTPPSIELDAYFVRIGYAGPRAPTLGVLRELCRLQTQAIAFENLDPLLGRPPKLDLASLQDKLLHGGRGGYCFELNLLLQAVLAALGFEVRALAARVQLNAPQGALAPRTHVLLHVSVEDQPFIADVGFGRLTPTAPLLLEPGLVQDTPHGAYRIDQADPEYELHICVGGDWLLLYRFHLIEHFRIDHEVNNHFVATHPSSFFRTSIVAAIAAPDGRHVLFNDRLAFQHRDGQRDEQVLTGADALFEALATRFGVRLPNEPGLRAAFERIKAMA